jgi:hypothetical protein
MAVFTEERELGANFYEIALSLGFFQSLFFMAPTQGLKLVVGIFIIIKCNKNFKSLPYKYKIYKTFKEL